MSDFSPDIQKHSCADIAPLNNGGCYLGAARRNDHLVGAHNIRPALSAKEGVSLALDKIQSVCLAI
jgi:hypothetical protein